MVLGKQVTDPHAPGPETSNSYAAQLWELVLQMTGRSYHIPISYLLPCLACHERLVLLLHDLFLEAARHPEVGHLL